jgi:hypothetical protein
MLLQLSYSKILWMLLLLFIHELAVADSSSGRKHILPAAITYTSNLSASYISYKNWKYSGFDNFAFLLRENFNYDTVSVKWEKHVRINAELGFIKFKDSIWHKSNDDCDLSIELIRTGNKRTGSAFSMSYGSQMLSDYEIRYDANGEAYSAWAAGFCNPMSLDVGYGTTVKFWKSCRLNLNYVNFHSTVSPLIDGGAAIKEGEILYKKSLIRSEYGFTVQTMIRHNITQKLRWENYSKLFANAVNRNNIDLDLRNKFVLKLLKHVDLTFDSRLRYAPVEPYLFQFRNELMLSFSLERL